MHVVSNVWIDCDPLDQVGGAKCAKLFERDQTAMNEPSLIYPKYSSPPCKGI
jgi:hypothetical protein